MSNYLNPCDSCEKAEDCRLGYGCDRWKIRYLYRQKQINAYARKLADHTYKPEPGKAFVYEHPDIIRRYLRNGPCGHCQREKVCEDPCPAYWRWWDARMEWFERIFSCQAR